jgi:FAD dependent oxidoreductase TIGR03364
VVENQADVIVIGGGIVGLAFAYEAAKLGRSVVLFERSIVATGASIRNFGMVWPVGQVPGAPYRTALRSRQTWLMVCPEAGIWYRPCGSVHVVHEADEWQVLQEFYQTVHGTEFECELLDASETLRRFPATNPEGLLGSLFSPMELVIDSPRAIAQLPKYLAEKQGVVTRFGETIVDVEMPRVVTASGETWRAERVFVCSGTDFETLFPDFYAQSGIRRCKLQMMRSVPQPNDWQLGPHFAGGLTLGHYKAFEVCPSLPALKKRFAETMPMHVKYGIHVMASQNSSGEIVIGDSHEYDQDISIFDKPEIDDLILSYLRKMIRLPEWSLSRRWHGVYAKHPSKTFVTHEPQPGCVIAAAPGGAGMTLSFGFAAEWWDSYR